MTVLPNGVRKGLGEEIPECSGVSGKYSKPLGTEGSPLARRRLTPNRWTVNAPEARMPQEIVINGKPFEHYWITGKVAGASKHLETRISGGGGGGYSHQGTGFSSTAPITSQTVTHDQIFLADGTGKEHTLKLQNWDLATREGHELTAVWLIKKGKSTGPYVAIRNHTTDDLQYNDTELAKLHRPTWALLSLVTPFVLGSTGVMLAIGGLVFWWVQGVRGRNAIKASGQLVAPTMM